MKTNALPELQCKPDWSMVCSSQGCVCEYRPPWAPSSAQPLPCQPPMQMYCINTMCMCSAVTVETPPVVESPPLGSDCSVIAAIAATAIFKAFLACR